MLLFQLEKVINYWSKSVKGFILKESAVDDILEGVEIVSQGGYFLSPKLKEMNLLKNSASQTLLQITKIKLTKTEQKIIRLISENQTTKQIAALCLGNLFL